MSKEICSECSNQAVSHCAICGKPLCQDHIRHGSSKRTNAHCCFHISGNFFEHNYSFWFLMDYV